MGKLVDLTGQVFGRLTALRQTGKCKSGGMIWLCRCECGVEKNIKSSSLRRGVSLSCGCYNVEVLRSRGLPYAEGAINNLYLRYKDSAAKRRYSFEIDIDFFKDIIKMDCTYCGTPASQYHNPRGYATGVYYSGIDRYDNNLGYTVENCVPCCKHCNTAKMLMTAERYIQHCERVVRWQKK